MSLPILTQKYAVQQRHNTSCGAAALATIIDVDYYNALNAIHPDYKLKQYLGTDVFQLRNAIKKFNLSCKISYRSIWKDLTYNAIVMIQWLNGKFHWVVWSSVQQKFLDPAEKFTKRKYNKTYTKQKYVNAFNRSVAHHYIVRIVENV